MTIPQQQAESCNRRSFLATVAEASAAASALAGQRLTAAGKPVSPALQSAIFLGDKFVEWQAPYGRPDPEKCPYRTRGKFDAFNMHGCGPMARALYRLYGATKDEKYKAAADGYALFLINALHDPPTTFSNTLVINGVQRTSLSSSWMYGKAIASCYEEFCKHNPAECLIDAALRDLNHRQLVSRDVCIVESL